MVKPLNFDAVVVVVVDGVLVAGGGCDGVWGAALYGWDCCCFCSGVPEPSSAANRD